MSQITEMLHRLPQEEGHTAEELLPLVYAELRTLAAHKMAKEASGHTLQATALVHEAWLRLSHESGAGWKNQEQFYAMAAEVMRRILVDRARRRRSCKHGGEMERVELDCVELPIPQNDSLILQVHDALERLASLNSRCADVVKLRFFVGLDNREVAATLGVSEKTVQRCWAFAKAWLVRAIERES